MSPPKSVSIIIRALNEEKYLRQLLEGIERQRCDLVVETILVDSGSTDQTIPIAVEFEVKILHISPSEFSFGRAINLGVREASGDICVLISAHCFPHGEDWIEQLLHPFENDEIGLVFGKQRGIHTTKFSEHAIFAKWFPTHDVQKTNFPFCNNANSAFRRDLWTLQSFDESLTGLEDIAWAKNIIDKGYHISYKHQALVYHAHDENYQTIFRRYYREALAYRRIFHNQHFHLGHFVKYFSLNVFGDLWMAYNKKCLLKSALSIVMFRFMQFWGTYKGYRYRVSVSSEMAQRLYYPCHPKAILKEKDSLYVVSPTGEKETGH